MNKIKTQDLMEQAIEDAEKRHQRKIVYRYKKDKCGCGEKATHILCDDCFKNAMKQQHINVKADLNQCKRARAVKK